MKIQVGERDPRSLRSDVVACFAYEGDREPRSLDDTELRRALAGEMRRARFEGHVGDLLWWNEAGARPRRFLVVGVGRERTGPGEAIRGGSARAARAAAGVGARRLGLQLPAASLEAGAAEVRAAVEGALLGAYNFERHLSERSRRTVRLEALEISATHGRALGAAARLGEAGARAVFLARDLVNEGPSRMNPTSLTRVAVAEARRAGLGCRVLEPAELRRRGFHALLAVARGSEQPARVVHLRYRPARRRGRGRIVLVGKGVTFDSGGLNLKPSDSMLTMKMDMAGAAAVLATMSALGAVGCRAEVHGVLGLVENMGGGNAYKPGDILDSYAGKTIEVMNTDAEGRLVLADLLAYVADRLRPTCVVDLATLTGACVVALGNQLAGLFTRDEALGAAVLAASRAAGERLWRLPLVEEYLPALQKGPADLRSTGGRWGGAITAALFLGEFVPRDVPWAHLDIAGPAFTELDLPEARAGGTGTGVLTLLRWLEAV